MIKQELDLAEQDQRRYRAESWLLLSFAAGVVAITLLAAGAFLHLVPMALGQWLGAAVVVG